MDEDANTTLILWAIFYHSRGIDIGPGSAWQVAPHSSGTNSAMDKISVCIWHGLQLQIIHPSSHKAFVSRLDWCLNLILEMMACYRRERAIKSLWEAPGQLKKAWALGAQADT
jgi:hypothetical protein